MSDQQDWRFKGFQNELGSNPTAPRGITATSRATSIPNPSGTNWNSTFAQNNPGSPSGTDWNKQFGSSNGSPAMAASGSYGSDSRFSFNLSANNDAQELSLTSGSGRALRSLYGSAHRLPPDMNFSDNNNMAPQEQQL